MSAALFHIREYDDDGIGFTNKPPITVPRDVALMLRHYIMDYTEIGYQRGVEVKERSNGDTYAVTYERNEIEFCVALIGVEIMPERITND